MNRGLVNRIIPFSSVDGPGNRTTIFLQGCNFNCLYCHNPETINVCSHCGICVEHCPAKSLSLTEDQTVNWDKSLCAQCDTCIKVCGSCSSPKAVYMTVDEVIKEILKTRAFISGITVSGGECTLQMDFLIELFKEVKKLGLTALVDSNGSTPFWEHEELVQLMDGVMLDIKSFNPEEHKMLTGMDNNIVLENAKYLASINKLYEVRTVIVPELLDNSYNVNKISELIGSLDGNIRYKLIKYRALGVRTNLLRSYTPSEEMINKLAEMARANGCHNVITV